MPSLADLWRTFLLRQLGLSSSSLSEADLQAALLATGATYDRSDVNEKYATGLWYPTPGTNNVVQPGDDILCLSKKYIGPGVNINGIACEVSTAGSAGCLVRAGVYILNSAGTLLDLLVDAGALAADSVGAKDFVIATKTIPNSSSVFFGIVTQGAPAVDPIYRGSTGTTDGIGRDSSISVMQNSVMGYRIAGVNGALPAQIAVPTASTIGIGPRMAFKVA